MKVRLAFESDLDAIVGMARMNHEETRPEMEFDENRCVDTVYQYLDTANPTIWVADGQSGVVGFLLATVNEYRAFSGQFTTQEILFVKPANRGSRAATLLMRELIAWSEMLGVRECIGGVDNGHNMERTAKFLGHFGFEKVGYAMRRAVSNGR